MNIAEFRAKLEALREGERVTLSREEEFAMVHGYREGSQERLDAALDADIPDLEKRLEPSRWECLKLKDGLMLAEEK